MMKAKLDMVIKLIGLSFGLAVCVMCTIYIMNELSFNSYYKDTDNVYRVLREYTPNETDRRMHGGTSSKLSQLLIDEVPEIQYATRYNSMYALTKYNNNALYQRLTAVDSSFFNIFNVEVSRGQISSIFKKPFTILITEEFAERVFPDEDPIGKMVMFSNYFIENKYFEVTGIIKTPPRNIEPGFDAITCEKRQMPDWFFDSWALESEYLPVSTYIKLYPGTSAKDLQAKLHAQIPPKMGDNGSKTIRHFLQPFKRIYLYSRADFNLPSGGDIKALWMFVLLAGIILTIVCINYINLTIARFTLRTKEISIRKVNGATKGDLRRTIVFDSLLSCFISIPFALLIAYFGLDLLNQHLRTDLELSLIQNPSLLLAIFLIAIFTGIVSSLYPALVYCNKTPTYLLHYKTNSRKNKNVAKQVLVIFQFSVSIILMVITIVWHAQYNHYIGKDPGFTTGNMLISDILGADPELRNNSQKVIDAVKENPDIELSSAIHILPGTIGDDWTTTPEGHDMADFSLVVHAGDVNIVKMFGLKIQSGRDFSETNKSDMTEACLLNETAVKALGWKDPIGKRINWMERDMRVIGVVKDYHAAPFNKKIAPTMVVIWETIYNYIAFKVDASKYEETREYLGEKLKELSPDNGINIFTYDDITTGLYASMRESSMVFGIFSLIAILLACLGLFSLSLFSILQRIKEIGIRKTVGAKSSIIVFLFLKDLLKWVTLAFIISCPVAYYLAYSGIKSYYDRVSISWWVFAIAGSVALLIGTSTVIFHTLRAANRNPVEALRYE